MKFKYKIRNFFNNNITPSFGIFACVSMIILSLVSLILIIVQLNLANISLAESGFQYQLINTILNIIFYLIVLNYFRKSSDNYYYCYIAMLILTISNYIIPLIFNLLDIFVAGLDGIGLTNLILSLVSAIGSSLFGILYFCFMSAEVKTRKTMYLTILLILGLVVTGFALFTLITNLYLIIISFIGGSSINYVVLIVSILTLITNFAFSFLYLTYAFDVKRIRTRGY